VRKKRWEVGVGGAIEARRKGEGKVTNQGASYE